MTARNMYAGPCYRCGDAVEKGQGHFEKAGRKADGSTRWITQHADCAIIWRGKPNPTKEEAKAARPTQ